MSPRAVVLALCALGAGATIVVPGLAAPPVRTPPETAAVPAPTSAPRPAALRAAAPSPFEALETCERLLAARSKKRPAAARRIASWNIRWFPDGSARGPGKHTTDLAWLACTIAVLDVQVVAVQEIVQHTRGRAALLDLLDLLDARTAGKWSHDMDDCPGSGRQHVGFLWDTKRVEVTQLQPIAALNPGKHACGKNLRPGFGAHARFPDGTDLHIVTVHLDSGLVERDHENRKASLGRLGSALKALTADGDPDVLVLGDFNTMGCKKCAPPVTAAAEVAALETSAKAAGMKRLDTDAMCSHYYGSQPGLLDHVLARGPGVLAPNTRVEVHGACRDLACRPLRRGEHPASLDHLSDHCPLVVEIPARTRE